MADSDGDLSHYPPWREALRRIVEGNFPPGYLFTHEWMFEALSIQMPGPETPWHIGEATRLEYLSERSLLQKALLMNHKKALQSVAGQGYRIVPATEQTDFAERKSDNEIRRSLKTRALLLLNLDDSVLDADQRRRRSDALARLASMRNLLGRVRRLPEPRPNMETG